MNHGHFFGLRGKTTLGLGALMFLSLIIISLTSYLQSQYVAERKVIELEQSKFALLKHEIEGALNKHRNLLMSLHDVPPVQAIIRARTHNGIDPESDDTLDTWRERLSTIFAAFLKNNPQYLQIRFIDAVGDELVRVQTGAGSAAEIVAGNELQNKAGSTYVRETLKLRAGEIYSSDVSLNREHGVIQVPFVPVMRLATPVHSVGGQVHGLIVINLSVDRLFSDVRSEAGGVQRNIVDEKGYYIKHADSSKIFGLERNVDYRLHDVEPELAEIARTRDHFIRHDESQRELDGFQKIYFAAPDRSRYWLIMLHVPESVVFADVAAALNRMLLTGLATGSLLLILIVWFVSRKILAPVLHLAAAARQLQDGNLAVRVDESSARDEFRTLFSAVNAFAVNQQLATSRLQQEVDAQTRKLSAVINNVVDGIITINANGMIESLNPAASRIFGYTDTEAIGRNVNILMPEPYHSAHDGYIDHYIRTGEKKIIGIGREVVGRRRDGSVFPMELAVSEVVIDNLRHFVGITRDITERKQAEHELHDFTSRLEMAARAMKLGIWEYKIQSGELIWDDRMFELYGLDRKSFPGAYEAWEHALHPDDMARSVAELNDAIAGKKEFDTTFRIIWPSGEVRDIQAAALVRYDEAGQPSKMIGMNWDITERKRVERMQKEFISTVSHELRTPLTSIRGSLGLILGGVTGKLPEKAQSLLTIANKNSERLIMLINDILDIEKIAAGKMQFEYAEADLISVIRQAIESNKGYADQLHVRFALNADPDNAIPIHIDEKRMMQVMSNLLSNAAKYSPEGDAVTISIERSKKHIRIAVHDNGKGIPDEFRSRIFSKFAQADSSDTRQKGGTGLGLSISKAIVEKHGGSIGFDSKPGKGTTFYVDLPAISPASVIKKEAPMVGNPLILIVEDDPDISRLISMMLEKEGYGFHQAYTYQQAKEHLQSHKYDAITLDLIIPGGDGLSLLHELHKSEATRDIPVVVISAHAKEFQAKSLREAVRVLGWIEKPIDEQRLLDAIHAALADEKDKSPSILHVEDDRDVAAIVDSILEGEYAVIHAYTLQQARELLTAQHFDLLLLDISLPDGSGLDLLPLLPELKKSPPVLIFSALDVDPKMIGQVSGVLIKSRTDNEKLIQQIKAAMGRKS